MRDDQQEAECLTADPDGQPCFICRPVTIQRESVEDALENDRCGICLSVEHFREDCPPGPNTVTPAEMASDVCAGCAFAGIKKRCVDCDYEQFRQPASSEGPA